MQINLGPKRVEIHQNKDKLEMLCQFGKPKRCSRSRMFFWIVWKEPGQLSANLQPTNMVNSQHVYCHRRRASQHRLHQVLGE